MEKCSLSEHYFLFGSKMPLGFFCMPSFFVVYDTIDINTAHSIIDCVVHMLHTQPYFRTFKYVFVVSVVLCCNSFAMLVNVAGGRWFL